MLLRAPFKADHAENRMSHEGDVVRAREHFFSGNSQNLRRLLEQRYRWMNDFIPFHGRGIEVGCGTGISKEFIRAREYLVTDFAKHPWLDVAEVDALNTRFESQSFDFVVSSNMVHHVPYPVRFFHEMERILKPGGVLLVQEINASLCMRAMLRMMRHEGYSFNVDVFDPAVVCTDPHDLWSANCAIPNLLFDDPERFEKELPRFQIIKNSYSEFINFLNSGGVIAKTFSIPLPLPILKVLERVDRVLTTAFPTIFALQRSIVLRVKNCP